MQKYHDEPKQYKGYLKSALTKPLRLDIQCQRAASVKIGWLIRPRCGR